MKVPSYVCDGKRNDLNTGAVLGEAVKVAPPLPTIATAKPAPPAPTREVPKPTVKPTLTPKLKVLPVKTENLDKLPERTKLVEEGWKWIRIQMVLENTSQQELLIFQSVFNPGLSKFKITTAEGFTYGVPHCYDEEEGLSLPPTFRVRGHVLPGQATWERRLLEICSKVPTLSTDYILRHPDSSEINVTKSFVDPDKLRYPTDRPDSDFSKVGTIFNIPNKGTATIVDLSKDNVETSERRRYGGSSSDIVYKLTARFINTNKGQDNYFVITIGRVFGTDGFIYRPRWADDQSSSYANTLGGTVGPSLTKDFKKYFVLPGQFPGGKFPVGGDIETIFNFDAK